MNQTLRRLVYERLFADEGLGEDPKLLVLAACDGPAELDEALESERAAAPSVSEPPEAPEPVGAYLGDLAIEGFRGIGDLVTLPLKPGPGLTLVIGRNGSGKSSFAEGLEVLLTGDSKRWSERSLIWREGWRNLHRPFPASITAQMFEEGKRGPTVVRRTWPEDADLDGSSTAVQPLGRPKTGLEALGLEGPLTTYRPFLSYNELGSMLDDGPSKLYDALSAILGLEDLVSAAACLDDARKERDGRLRQARAAGRKLVEDLEGVEDERAPQAMAAIGGRTWDLEAVEALVAGAAGTSSEDDLGILRRLCELEPPASDQSIDEAVEALMSAADRVAAVADTPAQRARDTASLLRDSARALGEGARVGIDTSGVEVAWKEWSAGASLTFATRTRRPGAQSATRSSRRRPLRVRAGSSEGNP